MVDSADRCWVASPAKLNLFLELLRRREDGFHELDTVMATWSLLDYLELTRCDSGNITLRLNTGRRFDARSLPIGEENLIFQALRIMREAADIPWGAKVVLQKNIPTEAGLGGASSNAAAALIGANVVWGLNWPIDRLAEIAAGLGSDVPFFLTGGWGRCTGRGEQVHNLNYRCRLNLVVVKPEIGCSTAAIYARCQVPDRPMTIQDILSALHRGQIGSIGRRLFNRLQEPAVSHHQEIAELQQEFAATDCVGHQLTGSGSCYFGVYRNIRSMNRAANVLANRLPNMNVFTGHTLNLRNYCFKT